MDESFRSSLLKNFPYNFPRWRTTGKSKTMEKQVQGNSGHFSVSKALLTVTKKGYLRSAELPGTEVFDENVACQKRYRGDIKMG